jgi:catechol 2,3-dioxygenase-like lactoylglutathione lyase family enzyme
MAWSCTRGQLVAMAVLSTILPRPAPAASPVRGLDHVVVAVADLDSAAARYRALGFALKRGRPHDNGIRNQHVKFRDGTEIELLAAPEARDSLTAQYRRHLAGGDGPAFFALYTSNPDELGRWLKAGGFAPLHEGGLVTFPAGDPLHEVFFGGRNRSITDQPENFAHANTADALVAMWLAGEGVHGDRDLLVALGARAAPRTLLLPDSVSAEVMAVGDGEVYLLPVARQVTPGRKIVGATVRVRNLEKAREVLARAGFTGLREARSERGHSLFLPPAVTHGIWLELLERR